VARSEAAANQKKADNQVALVALMARVNANYAKWVRGQQKAKEAGWIHKYVSEVLPKAMAPWNVFVVANACKFPHLGSVLFPVVRNIRTEFIKLVIRKIGSFAAQGLMALN